MVLVSAFAFVSPGVCRVKRTVRLLLDVAAFVSPSLYVYVLKTYLRLLCVCLLVQDFDPLGGWYVEWSALPQRGWGFKPSATTADEDGDEEDEQGSRAGVTQVRREKRKGRVADRKSVV